jgi:hypothetical protein
MVFALVQQDVFGLYLGCSLAGPLRAENLPVPGVMGQEADLSEHHGQERGHRSCHHESPTRTKAAHPAASSTAVAAIFQA